MSGRLRLMLLYGGRSAEHDVSRVSAAAVARALDPARYEIVPVGITRDGRWLLSEEAREALAAGLEAVPESLPVGGSPVLPPVRPGRAEVVTSAGERHDLAVDVVFPVLHGPYGEDGTVQGLLELADLPYVGAGVLASAVGMDKVAMKRLFAAAGLDQARHLVLREGGDRAELAARVRGELGLPCFVKPANLGSSIGVAKAHDEAELAAAIAGALEHDEWIVVEEAIAGREVEVAILGDDPPRASVPGEIVPGAEFYDYADKYESGAARLLVPAPLGSDETEEVRTLALAAFEACRGEALARVDFFYEEGGRGFLVNEVNTMPGFTPISMYPKLWEASGLPYPQLLDRLVEQALERHRRRRRRSEA